jgi:cold shock CspA family protein
MTAFLGTITSGRVDKGFFFVEADETHISFFIHISEVRDRRVLHAGERVSFKVVPNPVRPGLLMASDVEFVGGATAVRS